MSFRLAIPLVAAASAGGLEEAEGRELKGGKPQSFAINGALSDGDHRRAFTQAAGQKLG
jgi:hypothetical protein